MKENILEFYVNKFYHLNSLDSADVTFIPPILKRKTSSVDKAALTVMNKTYDDNIQNIVFSSQFGEVERLLKIIDQYTLDKEVSPNIFSSSVHNYTVGFFLFNIKKTIPYTALSATDASISAGLTTSAISKYDNTLYCFCDVNDNKVMAFSVNISKKRNENALKFRLTLKDNKNLKDDFNDFVKLFKGEIKELETPSIKLERIKE